MAELGTKRRVRLPAEPPPTPCPRPRRSPLLLAGLALWALAVIAGAVVTTPRARRAEWWAWARAQRAAIARRASFVWSGVSASRRAMRAPTPAALATGGAAGSGARATERRAPASGSSRSAAPAAEGRGGAGGASGPPRPAPASGAGREPELPTCEAALRAHRERAMDAGDAGLRVSTGAYYDALAQGSYLRDCEGAYDLALSLCVAVRGGRVVGVTARAEPPHPEIERCLRRVVAALEFEARDSLDVTEVTFAGR